MFTISSPIKYMTALPQGKPVTLMLTQYLLELGEHSEFPSVKQPELRRIACFCLFLRRGLAMSPRLEGSSTIPAHCSLDLLSSSNPPSSVSQSFGITGMSYHTWLISVCFVETRSHHVAQAGLNLLSSRDPPALASQSFGITGHCAWPLSWNSNINSVEHTAIPQHFSFCYGEFEIGRAHV